MEYKILKEESFEDCAEIVEVFGQGCNYPTGHGVEGLHVSFDVLVNDKKWHFDFQTEDRSDNMTAYSGVEMTTAAGFGCDSDESGEFENYHDNSKEAEDIIEELCDRAEEICSDYFDECEKAKKEEE